MPNTTPLKDRAPNNPRGAFLIELLMHIVDEIYAIERNHDNEESRLNSLKEYISQAWNTKSESLIDNTPCYGDFISRYVFGDIPDSWTYEELRQRLFINVIAEQIAVRYKESRIIPTEEVPTKIIQFFDSIKPKQNEDDKGQDVTELCDMFDIEWDTVKNFKRHDWNMREGIVKSKTDKITKITYVYRDPSKTFYGRTNHEAVEFEKLLEKSGIRTPLSKI